MNLNAHCNERLIIAKVLFLIKQKYDNLTTHKIYKRHIKTTLNKREISTQRYRLQDSCITATLGLLPTFPTSTTRLLDSPSLIAKILKKTTQMLEITRRVPSRQKQNRCERDCKMFQTTISLRRLGTRTWIISPTELSA